MGPPSMDLTVHQNIKRTIALILGGGRGTRLYPLTAERAKPAVPLCGRYRLVDIPLSNCIHSEINRIFVLTQFNSASLHRHISHSYKFDTFSDGFVEILAAEQTVESGDWYQGTADAVRQQLRNFRPHQPQHYLILSGDHLYRMDYRLFMETHLRTQADITVGTIPVTAQAAAGFGIMNVRDDGRIVEFVEKPRTPEALARLATPAGVLEQYGLDAGGGREYLASMGVYLFRCEVLDAILEQQRDWVDFGSHVIPNSLGSFNVQSHLFSGFWEDIGTVRSYYDVSMTMASTDAPFLFQDGKNPIYTHPRYLPGSRLEDAHVAGSIICEGSHIAQAEIAGSIIGIRSVIFPRTRIEQSIVMGADFYEFGHEHGPVPVGIGEGTSVATAIIDKNARIGKNVRIRGSRDLPDEQGDGWAVRDGIVIVLKNATIPDGARIGAV